jgi:kynureninase
MGGITPTLADCQAWDAEDPLAFTRVRFRLPEGVIYLDGNSLGALPRATPGRLADLVEREWGQGLISSWNDAAWMTLPARVGARIAGLIGAGDDEVVAADSTSVNLYKLAAAAVGLRPDRRVVLSEPGNFPSDLYVLQGLCAGLGLELRVVPAEAILAALTEEVAVLVLTHVHYKSGHIHDMAAITAAAQSKGALALWDLSHSAGALPVDLNRCNADFAVGCGYKYLNGGPGAPGYMMAARRHHAAMGQPLTGWIGHAAPFAFGDDFAPADGVTRLLTGTPGVIGLAALEEGLKTFEGVSIQAVREKSLRLGDLFTAAARDAMGAAFELACPADAHVRGSQVSLRHPHGYAIVRALIEAGVIGDFRAPDVARFGFTPLYLSYADVFEAGRRLKTVMDEELWRAPRFSERRAVT